MNLNQIFFLGIGHSAYGKSQDPQGPMVRRVSALDVHQSDRRVMRLSGSPEDLRIHHVLYANKIVFTQANTASPSRQSFQISLSAPHCLRVLLLILKGVTNVMFNQL